MITPNGLDRPHYHPALWTADSWQCFMFAGQICSVRRALLVEDSPAKVFRSSFKEVLCGGIEPKNLSLPIATDTRREQETSHKKGVAVHTYGRPATFERLSLP